MKKISKMTIAAKLFAVILCLALISGIASSATAAEAGESGLGKCVDAFEAAESIFTDLKEFIQDESAASDDDEGEFDTSEAEAMLKELQDYVNRLDGLISGLDGLSQDMNTSEGKTVRATRDYLIMLKNMAYDLNELVGYSLDFYAAVMPMGEMDENVEDYEEFADMIYINTSESLEMLNDITPPAYLAITHNDLIARVQEFNDFALDFYMAAYMEDPLRIYSCMYRMDRIEAMFTKCGGNLDDDIMLQLRQAERRIGGPISTLRSELSATFELLKGGN